MLDKRMRGGSSIILRCSSEIKGKSNCPFYCKLRRNNHNMWYICQGFEPNHDCPPCHIPPRFRNNIGEMLSLFEESNQNTEAVTEDDAIVEPI